MTTTIELSEISPVNTFYVRCDDLVAGVVADTHIFIVKSDSYIEALEKQTQIQEMTVKFFRKETDILPFSTIKGLEIV